eukprot:224601-Alexandrium_andersonii.AAC.1
MRGSSSSPSTRARPACRSRWAPGQLLPPRRSGCWGTGGPWRARGRAGARATSRPTLGGPPTSARCAW